MADLAGEPAGEPGLDPVRAGLALRRLAQPAGVRARLYDRSGRLIGDTRSFGAEHGPIDARPLPPPNAAPQLGLLERLVALYDSFAEAVSEPPELYREVPLAGVAEEREVYVALRGDPATAVRANSEGELIVSAALPVQRFRAVHGALVLSTEGGDIDAVVRAERLAILRVSLVALAVTVTLSALLAAGVARPLRRLAVAARSSGAAQGAPGGRRALPDYSRRSDEIGELSSALRRMTERLYDRLEAAERFAADVAHEIKNPLSSLRSASETLARTERPEQRERLMAVMRHDVRRLDRLVTDIANASRLDAELAREAAEPVDLSALLRGVAEVATARAAARGVRFQVRAEPRLRAPGLDTRLGQVFVNLLDNAASFSPPGGLVRIRARARGRMAEIRVEDEGPGVPEERREAVFERFHTDRPEGEGFGDHSGLGLSIAQQIVAAHGGRIRVEDRQDGRSGAAFVVELPR